MHSGSVEPIVAGARTATFHGIVGAERESGSATVEISEAVIVEAVAAVSDTSFQPMCIAVLVAPRFTRYKGTTYPICPS